MACIQAKPHLTSGLCCSHEGGNGDIAVLGIAGGIRLCIEFHTVSTTSLGTFHHSRVGIYKDAGTDAGLLEGLADIRQESLVFDGVPAMITRQLVVAVRHQRYLRRHHLQHQFGKRINGISLDVKLCSDNRTNVTHVLIADVSLVRSRMHRNALRTKHFHIARHLQYIGVITASGIAQCGDFVDIYTQFRHISFI